MNNGQPLKIGIVGCGGISHAHGRAAQNTPAVDIVACCDVDAARATQWGETYSAAAYDSMDAMLAAERLDAVLLATWPVQHLDQVRTLLDCGIRNILCEKALAASGAKALEIGRLVKQAGAFLMEGVMYRHHPLTLRMREVIDRGDIGKVDCVRGCFSLYDAETEPADSPRLAWNNRPECCNGVPHEIAVYPINACNYFSGSLPRRVFCTGGMARRYEVIHRFYGLIEYADSATGIIQSSKKAAHNRRLEIAGGDGTLRTDIAWRGAGHDGPAVATCTRNKPWPRPVVDTFETIDADSYQLQLQNFADAIAGHDRPRMPLHESIINIITLDALLESLETGRSVDVVIPEEWSAS